jgi:hypothetical protein
MNQYSADKIKEIVIIQNMIYIGVNRKAYRNFDGWNWMKETAWQMNKLKAMNTVNVQIQALINPTLGRG